MGMLKETDIPGPVSPRRNIPGVISDLGNELRVLVTIPRRRRDASVGVEEVRSTFGLCGLFASC